MARNSPGGICKRRGSLRAVWLSAFDGRSPAAEVAAERSPWKRTKAPEQIATAKRRKVIWRDAEESMQHVLVFRHVSQANPPVSN